MSDYQLREDHFVVIECLDRHVRAGIADLETLPKIFEYEPDSLPFSADGHLDDMESLVLTWKKVFSSLKIKISRNHSAILLSLPSSLSKNEKELIVQVMFERFNVPGLYLADLALMSLYGYGQHLSGLIVNFGSDSFTSVPIVEALVQHHAISGTGFGQTDVVEYLLKLLKEDPSLSNNVQLLDYDVASHILSTAGETSVALFERREKEVAKVAIKCKDTEISVGEPRIKAMEMPFNPKIAGLHDVTNIAECIYNSVAHCDVEKRKALLEHVILTGNFFSMTGFKDRLEKEITKLIPQTEFANEIQPKSIKFAQFPDYIECFKDRPDYASFFGGCVAAKMIFADMKNYLTKLDYNERGPASLKLKDY